MEYNVAAVTFIVKLPFRLSFKNQVVRDNFDSPFNTLIDIQAGVPIIIPYLVRNKNTSHSINYYKVRRIKSSSFTLV